MHLEQARLNMIEQQVRPWDVLDQTVLDTLRTTPRELFVPERYRQLAFADTGLPLAHGQIMMCPRVEGRLLQALAISKTDTVLEIGTGSAYLTACLSKLAKQVDSVDIYQDFIDQARPKLDDLRLANIKLGRKDAATDCSDENQYDVIVITGSLPSIPASHQRALKRNGRLFVIIGRTDEPIMQAVLITRSGENQWMRESLFETYLPPLLNATSEPRFTF